MTTTHPVRAALAARTAAEEGRVPAPVPSVPGQLAIRPLSAQLALPDPDPDADPGPQTVTRPIVTIRPLRRYL